MFMIVASSTIISCAIAITARIHHRRGSGWVAAPGQPAPPRLSGVLDADMVPAFLVVLYSKYFDEDAQASPPPDGGWLTCDGRRPTPAWREKARRNLLSPLTCSTFRALRGRAGCTWLAHEVKVTCGRVSAHRTVRGIDPARRGFSRGADGTGR